eukprot:5871822-Pyramimonas_sp.AAC.1
MPSPSRSAIAWLGPTLTATDQKRCPSDRSSVEHKRETNDKCGSGLKSSDRCTSLCKLSVGFLRLSSSQHREQTSELVAPALRDDDGIECGVLRATQRKGTA